MLIWRKMVVMSMLCKMVIMFIIIMDMTIILRQISICGEKELAVLCVNVVPYLIFTLSINKFLGFGWLQVSSMCKIGFPLRSLILLHSWPNLQKIEKKYPVSWSCLFYATAIPISSNSHPCIEGCLVSL